MPNPIRLLAQAIRFQNWPLAREAYEELAGEPAPEAVNDEEPSLVLGTEGELHKLEQEGGIDLSARSMEPCADCGQDYPRSELLAGEVLCAACRAKPNRLDGKEQSPPTPAPQEEKATAKPPHRADIEQFRVNREPSRARSEGGTYARAEPVVPIKNKYKDNLAVARQELLFDKMLVEKGVRPAAPVAEPRAAPGMVTATCRDCGRSEQVSAALAPLRRFANDDEGGSTHVCESCIREKASSRRG